MNTIKFNDKTYEVINFSKNTYFYENSISSAGVCSILTNDISSLHELAHTGIQTIQIYHDGTLIYDLDNANGRLTQIDEFLSDDHININLNFGFDVQSESEPEVEPEPEQPGE